MNYINEDYKKLKGALLRLLVLASEGKLQMEDYNLCKDLILKEQEKIMGVQQTLSCPICDYTAKINSAPLTEHEFNEFPEWTPFWDKYSEMWVFFVGEPGQRRRMYELTELVNTYTCFQDAVSQHHNDNPKFEENVFFRTEVKIEKL